MDRRFSVGAGGTAAAMAIGLGVVGAYAVGVGQRAPASAAETNPSDVRRTMVVTGTGDVAGVPDQLSFDVAVHAKEADVSTAWAEANATMRRLLATLAEQGVQRKDVQTTGLSIRPVYQYFQSEPPHLDGYRVSERAEVLVRSLSTAGKTMGAAVTAGGNAVRVSEVRLRIGGMDALAKRARDEAVAQARAKAEQYAAAAGQSLGGVLSLKEVDTGALRAYPVPAQLGLTRGAADSATVPIRAGREQVKVTVSVVWEIA
jgi:uncharacterized protein